MKYVTHIGDGRISTSRLWGGTYNYVDDTELVAVVRRLIREGYAFVHQPHGWPPAAILQDLQEKGLLTDSFIAITWTDDGQQTFEVSGPRKENPPDSSTG